MAPEFTCDPLLEGVIHVRPARHGDARGWFSEIYNKAAFAQAGIRAVFVQDNQSASVAAGTLRGLHFQAPPVAQAKLVRCVRGRVLDVAVDLRRGSATFGRHTRAELTAEGGEQIFIPEGFAHGFCTLEAGCEVAYKVTAPYAREADFGIAHDDPSLAIDWPFPADKLTLSDRDRGLPPLDQLPDYFSVAGEAMR